MDDGVKPEGDGAVYRSAMPDRVRRRRTRLAVGVVGMAAVLGAGAYLVSAQVIARNSPDVGALVPVVPTVVTSSPVRAAPSTSAVTPARPSRAAVRRSTSPAPVVPSVVPSATGLSVAGMPTNEQNVTTAEGTVRVVSAKFDLSGQGDLLMAGDGGRRVGDARCTRKLRFANAPGAREIPSMLLCWRTSSARSVVTVAVASQGKPSPSRSLELLNEEWAKLG